MNRMVETQIIARGIGDKKVITAMKTVDRAIFVPAEERGLAYEDHPLPIGFGQTISQPYIVAYMLEALELEPEMTVLEVGTGSGYQTALLSRMVRLVVSVETIPELALRAQTLLNYNGFENFRIIEGDGFSGYPGNAPYNAVIVSAAAPKIPSPLLEQLAEGGRIIIPLGQPRGNQYLTLAAKKCGEITLRRLIPVRFVPFISDKF